MRCTQATLTALGIPNICPKDGCGVVQAIQQAGLKWQLCYDKFGQRKAMTVRQFVASHPKGRYYFSTVGHAMALVDGVLTDTTGRGADGRHVEVAIEVN